MLELFNSLMKFINNHFPGRSREPRKVETIDASGSVWDKPTPSNGQNDDTPD